MMGNGLRFLLIWLGCGGLPLLFGVGYLIYTIPKCNME